MAALLLMTKVCPKCKLEKDLTAFHKKASYCKPCAIAKSKEWAKANPTRRKTIANNHVRNNRKKYRERLQKWRTTNLEKSRITNCRSSHNRRARIRNVKGSFSSSEWLELVNKYNGCCVACKQLPTENNPLTMDHVIPIALGGSNYIANIQPLCFTCNCRKHTRVVDYRWGFYV